LVTPRALATIAALGVVAAAPGARAQSRRYPPEPVDKDAERAAKSALWNAAITPERHPYQDLVRSATELLAQRNPTATADAITKLDEAVQLLPGEPAAYALRGDAYFERRDWTACTADYAAADAHTQRGDQPPGAIAELHRKLGLCQARAAKLGDAEQTLAETVASGNAGGEVWMRLGEVRIAMGKLDEAIAALRSAIDATEPAAQAMIHFLLATAYDRARRPADALVEAAEGAKVDRQFGVLLHPTIPPISPGEIDYMLALAYTADPSRPEYTLAYFRRFAKVAPDSPWRKRADEHIRDVKTAELPETVTPSGTAPLDVRAARIAIRPVMRQMRACLAKFPTTVVEIELSRAGPRTPPTDRLRPRISTPPDSMIVRRAIGELTDKELEAIDHCLQPFGPQLTLPTIKERDTYYKATFYVVGP
jgi:tetratricopeptide (TPR) repeat protein